MTGTRATRGTTLIMNECTKFRSSPQTALTRQQTIGISYTPD